MGEKRILFPYNFTLKDREALDCIIETYGKYADATVTVFHSYVPVPQIAVGSDTIMDKMNNNINYLRQKAAEEEKKIAEIQKLLINGGFRESQVNYLYLPRKNDTAKDIVNLVRERAFNTVVLSRSGGVAGFFKGSVFNKVVTALKDVTIVIVT